MTIVDLHVATIAYEMSIGACSVVQAIVIDAKYANVFRQVGETACAAKQTIGGNGKRCGHGVACLRNESGARGWARTAAIDAGFVTILHSVRTRWS